MRRKGAKGAIAAAMGIPLVASRSPAGLAAPFDRPYLNRAHPNIFLMCAQMD